jgi:hypothetical protein
MSDVLRDDGEFLLCRNGPGACFLSGSEDDNRNFDCLSNDAISKFRTVAMFVIYNI